MSRQVRFVVIGNPENRRVELFQRALQARGQRSASVVTYQALLDGQGNLADHLRPGTVLRIESPEKNFDVEKALLHRGVEDAEREQVPVLSPKQIEKLTFDRGRLLHPRQHHLGFLSLLRELSAAATSTPGVSFMNPPADIEIMFDKRLCHRSCAEEGVPVPQTVGPVEGYDELVSRMEDQGLTRVFVKLANGSAASGVVAFSRNGTREFATTTAEMVRECDHVILYNSRKLQTYSAHRDVVDLIDHLCREKVHVEQWLPKASFDAEGNVDFRVVVIAGHARHVVARQSRGPFTNLHLKNRRADVDSLRDRLRAGVWDELLQTCEKTMTLFPRSLYAGVDVLLMPDLRRHVVLELNAFGDLLPNVWWNGLDTYATEIETLGR